ncbi:potassium-transporting ATPase subunit KdpA, partial [Dyella sp.]|uniref:potassium-transporting ATPase subunit KdpA n=1 Tax=Dyella sp. TaxID=1869338 RepID=UPI002C763D25
MTANDFIQIGVYLVVLLLLIKPMGSYMTHVFADQPNRITRLGGGVERFIYRICGVKADEDMGWKQYAIAMLIFNVCGMVMIYVLQRAQQWLPLNPEHFPAVSPDSSINTAISFITNTNWQAYSGESTMSYLTQMMGLAVQNFMSAACGIAVAIAVVRGFA